MTTENSAAGKPDSSLFAAALACLRERDPDRKVELTGAALSDWRTGSLPLGDPSSLEEIRVPGRPERPELVPPRALARRSAKDTRGSGKARAALIHAVAHIEFNAINLAWDALYRFRGLPRAYYDDWVRVADEEAQHFCLMRDRLRSLGYDYGDFPAHDGLWSMALRTAGDPLERMALIPRVMEARGLDVTPGMIARLLDSGDVETADCLEIILQDEVGHVAAGTRWFQFICAERGLEAEGQYFALLARFLGDRISGPLNLAARRRAGFAESELERLQALCLNHHPR